EPAVARRADAVPLGPREARQLLGAVERVRVVAGGAGHLRRAVTEEENARLAGGDRAPARVAGAARAFPGGRGTAETGRVAAGRGGPAHRARFPGAGRLGDEEGALGLERRPHLGVVGVLPRAAVAHLAADAGLDELAPVEPAPGRLDRRAQRLGQRRAARPAD